VTLARPPRRRRLIGVALILTSFVSAGLGVATFQASAAGAVEFGSFDFRANAHGFSFFNDDASGARQGEGTVPHTEAVLQSGPVGSGLATIFWPGPLGANAGTLLLVLQPGCSATSPAGLPAGSTPVCPLPDAAGSALNYPVKASSRVGENPPTNTYNAPGTQLTSTAEAQKVTADAVVAQPVSATGSFGTTQSHSTAEQTSSGGSSLATSKVQDVNLGGVIKIDQVTSMAKATTDGSKAGGETATTVSGMTVGGQPAYVDESGMHIGTQGQPANAVANQIAQQALGQGGFSVYVSTPTKEINGASASVTAGSLIILQKSDSGVTGFILGGSHAQVSAAIGDASALAGLDDTGSLGGADSGLGSSSGSLDGTGPSLGGTPSGSGKSGGGPVALGNAQNTSSNGVPVKPAPVIFGLIAAFALAAGMRRLSDQVLAEQVTATTCSLDGDG